MTSQLLYIALGFGLGLIAAAAVGTLALLRWTRKPGADAGEADASPEANRETSDDSSMSGVSGSEYDQNEMTQETLRVLPMVVSIIGEWDFAGENPAPPYQRNVRTFAGNYETVREDDVSSEEDDVPSATELEKLLVVAHDENVLD